jgi:hypothetical protein
MVRRPPSSQEIKGRLAEWILSVWMNQLDPNVMGIRRVDDDKNGNGVPTVHIAIPLGYRRKQLAQTLSISQIEDEQTAPRVNLISSAGSDEAHSYIRVPAELIFSQFIASMEFQLLDSKEINDETIQVPEEAVEHFARALKRKSSEEHSRLKSAIQQAFAMKNAPLQRHQIQLLTQQKTGEKWIKILDVDRSMRTTIKLAIRQAGIQGITPPATSGYHGGWAIMFTATEARKLFVE